MKLLKYLCLITIMIAFFTSKQVLSQDDIPEPNELEIINVEQLTSGDGNFINPVFSPNGGKIAFSKQKFKGICLMSNEGADVNCLTDEQGAGYKFAWSIDGKDITYRNSIFENGKRFGKIKELNIENGEIHSISNKERNIHTPDWSYSNGKKRITYFVGKEKRSSAAKNVVSSQHYKLSRKANQNKHLYVQNLTIISQDEMGNEVVLTNKGFDPAWSPDKTKIIYSEWNNLIVMKADGTDKKNLGRGVNPSWAPDGEKIVYQISDDDGERITKSELYIINIDGTSKFRLTDTDDELEAFPNWSPEGFEIAYSSLVTGHIFKLSIK